MTTRPTSKGFQFAPNWAAIANIVGAGLVGAGSPGGWANFGPQAMQASQNYQRTQQDRERMQLLKERNQREKQEFDESQRTANQERVRQEELDRAWQLALRRGSASSTANDGYTETGIEPMPRNMQDPDVLKSFQARQIGNYGASVGGAQTPNVQTASAPDLFADLSPEQLAYMELAGRKAGLDLLGNRLFQKPQGPQSSLAKLKADLDAGLIDRPTYDALVRKETAMPQGPAPTETERLLRLAGIDPSSPEGQSIIKGKLSGGAGIQVDTNNDGVPDITVGGKGIQGKPTESNAQALFRGTLVGQAMDEIQTIADTGFANISPGRMAAAEFAGEYGPIGRFAGERLKSDEEKKYQAAISKATEGLVAAITGAGVAVEQFPRIQQMIPLPTDNPAMVRYKLDQLKNELNALKLSAGPLAPALTQGQGAPSAGGNVIRYDAQGKRIQ